MLLEQHKELRARLPMAQVLINGYKSVEHAKSARDVTQKSPLVTVSGPVSDLNSVCVFLYMCV